MVERHIKKSKTSNSCGTDRIPITYWKVLSTVLAAPISLLFNMFLRTGYIPWIWKQSLIIPLLKPKSVKTNLASYRPISLTCSLSKIFEKCILELLLKQIGYKLSIKQFGFKANGSTFQNLLYTYNHIFKALDANENIDLIFIDFSRAFDKVDYKILFDKIVF